MKHKLISFIKCLQFLPGYLTAFLFFIFSAKAFAQADTVKKLKEVNVKSANTLPSQTVVPSQHLSATEFDRYGALSVADAVTNFAGVNMRDYGGIGGLKTISVRSLGPNHTGVLYDGILLNDSENGQIDLGRFSLNNIQEITLYNGQPPRIVQPARSFASASILDIVTRHPQLGVAKPYQVTFGLNTGSFGLINPFLQWQQRINRQWSFIINGNYTGANGRYKYKNNDDGSDTLAVRTNGDVKTYQTDGALYWAKSDSNKFKLQFNYNNSDRGLPGPVILYQASSHQRLQNRDLLVQSGYEHLSDNSFHLLLNSKFAQNYLHYTDPDYLNNAGGANEHYTQREYYQSVSVGYHLLPAFELAYSSDVSVANLKSDIYKYYYKFASPTRVTLLNVLATNINAGKWHLQANILHTYINEQVQNGPAALNRSVFSPALSASFQPFEHAGFLLRAFYKDIFRAPTFSEQYYYQFTQSIIKPEHAKQYNFGATYAKNYDGALREVALTVDAYYNHVKDKIVYQPTHSADLPSAINLGLVDIKGMDITLKTVTIPATGWLFTFLANYTYQQALNVTDPADSFYLNQIPYTPKSLFNFNAGINYRQIGLYYNYILSSSRYYISNNDPEYYMPGYHTSNVSLACHFLASKLPVSASFQVNNLENLNYSIVRSYPMPGRSIRISMQITI